ncbi:MULTISPECIES: hypothetical protein [Burkholderiaceae]|jgi:hypothetical protein|uniref:hypothetical protein n=1 Tax=Burkholderiaceae TaxID=119060 RepID=UPI000D05355F|nr:MULTISPECIES: hypothetical protein [Burkholderiaceae]MBU9366369.1 hypothetical protein [Burkholderia multivorans]PRZ44888.1 hypothetical protein BX589_14355 [Paraburkholderia fungorum]
MSEETAIDRSIKLRRVERNRELKAALERKFDGTVALPPDEVEGDWQLLDALNGKVRSRISGRQVLALFDLI